MKDRNAQERDILDHIETPEGFPRISTHFQGPEPLGYSVDCFGGVAAGLSAPVERVAEAQEGREAAAVAGVEAVSELVLGDWRHIFDWLGVVLILFILWIWDAWAAWCNLPFVEFLEFEEVAVGVLPDSKVSPEETFGVDIGIPE